MNSGAYVTCVVILLTFAAVIVLYQRWRQQQQRHAAPETVAYVALDEVKVAEVKMDDLEATSECVL